MIAVTIGLAVLVGVSLGLLGRGSLLMPGPAPWGNQIKQLQEGAHHGW
jgi:hypothetical protein